MKSDMAPLTTHSTPTATVPPSKTQNSNVFDTEKVVDSVVINSYLPMLSAPATFGPYKK